MDCIMIQSLLMLLNLTKGRLYLDGINKTSILTLHLMQRDYRFQDKIPLGIMLLIICFI